MFEGKSRDDLLRLWLRAADEFTASPTPHVGEFALITGQVRNYILEADSSWVAMHVIEEIAGAKAKTSPDKVDKVLLRSRTMTSIVRGDAEELFDECIRDGIFKSVEESKQRLDAIVNAIQRRRRAIGLKGRGYFFD
jgi:hypothetical protein